MVIVAIVVVMVAIAAAIVLAIPTGLVLLLNHSFLFYQLLPYLTIGLDWFDIFNNLEKFIQDYLTVVVYPVHLAYNNVQNIYTESFHILDADQSSLFYFWLMPGLAHSTFITYDLMVAFVYPVLLFSFVRQPFYFIDEFTYRLTGHMKPKDGLPKMISQMWDIQKLMMFDETYLKDPLGYETELTVESFTGPIILLFVKPLIAIVLSPVLLIWNELAFWTQILLFLIYEWKDPINFEELSFEVIASKPISLAPL